MLYSSQVLQYAEASLFAAPRVHCVGHVLRRLSLMLQIQIQHCVQKTLGIKNFLVIFQFTFALFQISSFLIAGVNLSDVQIQK